MLWTEEARSQIEIPFQCYAENIVFCCRKWVTVTFYGYMRGQNHVLDSCISLWRIWCVTWSCLANNTGRGEWVNRRLMKSRSLLSSSWTWFRPDRGLKVLIAVPTADNAYQIESIYR